MTPYQVTFSKTRNLGDYNNEKLEITAQLDEDDCLAHCIEELKLHAYLGLGLEYEPEFYDNDYGEDRGVPKESSKENEEVPPVDTSKEEVKVETEIKEEKKKVTRAKKEEVKKEVKEDVESVPELSESEEVAEKDIPEVKEEEKVVEKKKTTVKLKVKLTPYDRNLEIHKKLFKGLLDSNFPTWKSKPATAKEASVQLEGEDFLNAEGEIVESFKTLLKKALE
jgi:flagellar biosynthesis GTPase FlhF